MDRSLRNKTRWSRSSFWALLRAGNEDGNGDDVRTWKLVQSLFIKSSWAPSGQSTITQELGNLKRWKEERPHVSICRVPLACFGWYRLASYIWIVEEQGLIVVLRVATCEKATASALACELSVQQKGQSTRLFLFPALEVVQVQHSEASAVA
jgi:hypothetical protein